MDEKIFDRTEKKYLITKKNYDILVKLVKKHMQKDQYYKSGVYNIYFDTDNYDLIIQSIDQPIFKEKLRARSYEGYDKVFFEVKTKLRGAAYDELLQDKSAIKDINLGYKRRVLITHQDYDDFVSGRADFKAVASRNIENPTDLQIAKEIDYMMQHFDLKPKILVYYDRESFKGEDDLRITFDVNTKYRNQNLKFSKNHKDRALLSGDKCIIMEIKAKGAMPLWLVKALSAEHIYPQRFSKIGNTFIELRKEQNV